ncbi:MAG: tetratricopeptide repeat protein [Gammaproteobacteria bacterium]|nr:tetratricopeptide repeat protein [Gammaproteobacteria bacterium]
MRQPLVLGTIAVSAHTQPMYRFAASVLLVVSMSASVVADQTDKRLDTLFGLLHETENPRVGEQITRQIWIIWRKVNSENADTLMDKGIRDMSLQRYDQALATFNKVVEIAPTYAEGWNKRATLLFLMGEYVGSVADIKRTLALEPRHFGAWSGLGLIHTDLDNDAAALRAFEQALEINPHLPGARHNIESIKKRQQEKLI